MRDTLAGVLPDATLDFETMTAELKQAGIDVNSVTVDESGTMFGVPAVEVPSRGLPVVVSGNPPEILLKERLSKGGMGEVLLALQGSLKREVAVKRATNSEGTDVALRELVIEARVAGALEHPNIVPVHILGATPEGEPLLVMKRVEGRTWRSLLEEGRSLPRDLAILMDVCRAIHFAHARGVVHRDVKPANVMVGSFGEVYLLDWGIAAGLEHSSIAELPVAATENTLVGTPHYMAPEMTIPGQPVDERTDVYLLGAVLHELITGSPPHKRANMREAIHAAHIAAAPTFDASIPEELAAICTRALRRDPRDRFGSADELRGALVAFQQHAAARELVDDAERRLARLRAMPADADPGQLQRTFNEARFAFEQALRIWPESTRAAEGETAAILAMAERELAAGRLETAEVLLTEVDDPPRHMTARVDELKRERARQAASVAEVARLAQDADVRVGYRERARILIGVSVVFALLSVSMGFAARFGGFTPKAWMVTAFLFCLTAGAGIAGYLSRTVGATSASRASFRAWLVGLGVAGGLTAVAAWFEAPPDFALALVGVEMGGVFLILNTPLRPTNGGSVFIWVGVPLLLLFPEWAFVIAGLTYSVAGVYVSTKIRAKLAKTPGDSA